MLQRHALALLLTLPSATALAAPAQYALDPVHTRVLFAIEHAGFSKALGTVSGSSGTLVFDPDDWTSARLQAQVPLQRLDLGDEKWNRAALARNLLDGERYPEARFVSTRIEPIDATHARVFGELSLHGVSREIALEVTLNALKRHPLPPFRRTVGFSATATLQRADFGIDAWPSMIGATVELRIEAEATRQGRAERDDPAQAAPTDPPVAPDPTQEPSP
ncbi:polyisoprenoid-binding protein [Xanthomonas sp. AmX2]|uniref:YceI family protein n=1 Tax=Xanthomonas sp. TaxID=29446 RepID=UPI00198097C3|nr:YceI family protein [Xanthomonas sp.]MBN6149567.1 polyisoprenoid-binding protein [Xanthomonas sp.]